MIKLINAPRIIKHETGVRVSYDQLYKALTNGDLDGSREGRTWMLNEVQLKAAAEHFRQAA